MYRRITPPEVSCIHRFYDTSPLSPSGRYLAYTRILDDRVTPRAGDAAFVEVIDVSTGKLTYSCPTLCWDTQVGAHAQWGITDSELFYNVLSDDGERAHGVRANIIDGTTIALSGTVYMVSPCGEFSAGPNLSKVQLVQAGYSYTPKPDKLELNFGFSETDGVYLVPTDGSEARLLASFRDLLNRHPDDFGHLDASRGAMYGFHCKWSPNGKWIMVILRWQEFGGKLNSSANFLCTISRDGRESRVHIRPSQWKGGHHPNWAPDSKGAVMNLMQRRGPNLTRNAELFLFRLLRKFGVRMPLAFSKLRFALIDFESGDIRWIGKSQGSGHPTISPNGLYIVSDAYLGELHSRKLGEVPIRCIDIASGGEQTLAVVPNRPLYSGNDGEWRVDPHPAWSKCGSMLVFNAFFDSHRTVCIMDVPSEIYQRTSLCDP